MNNPHHDYDVGRACLVFVQDFNALSIDEYGVVAQKDKVELSPDNDKVTALDYIPTTNCDGSFNDIGVFIFYYAKVGVLIVKTDPESISYEIGFYATI